VNIFIYPNFSEKAFSVNCYEFKTKKQSFDKRKKNVIFRADWDMPLAGSLPAGYSGSASDSFTDICSAEKSHA